MAFWSQQKKKWFVLLGIFLIVFLAYFPSLKNQFVNWDDEPHLLENQSIRYLDAEHLKKIFRESVNKTYIPLTSLSFALEYQRFGYTPFIYHLDNLILHLLVTGLIFFWAIHLGLTVNGAAIAALLFGLHPMHVESVAWVTERKDVLYSFFYMLALLSYWKYLKTKEKVFYFCSLLTGILSMLAKPMAVSLPLILLLCDWFYRRKIDKSALLEKAPHFLILGMLAWLTYQENMRVPGNGAGESILVWIWTFGFYLRQFIFPGVLLPIYHLPQPISLLNAEYLFAGVFFILFVALVVRFRRQRWLVFAALFYFFSIFFLLRFDETVDINVVADRFMYLPSVGFCLLAAAGWEKMQRSQVQYRQRAKFGLVAALIVMAGILSFRTFIQCRIWQNPFTLWQYQLLFNPNEPIALNNLANAYGDTAAFEDIQKQYRTILELKRQGVTDNALKNPGGIVNKVEFVVNLYKKAINIDPKYADAHYNLAKLYQDLGELGPALELYNKVIELNPRDKDTYFNLGKLYQEQNDPQKAISAYNQTIQIDPENPDLYINVLKSLTEAVLKDKENTVYIEARGKIMEGFRNLARLNRESEVFYANLGDVYQELKDYHSAKAAYEMALDINPNYINALNNLGNTYVQMGQLKEAVILFQKVLGISPRDFHAHLNLGVVYSRLENYPKAIEFYEKTIRINPRDAQAYFQLGFIYELKGQSQKAVENYQKTVQLKPDDAEAYYNLGNVYARLNQNDKAIESYLKTVEINPNHVNAFVNLSILYSLEKDFEKAIKYCDEARVLGWDVPKEYLRGLERYRKR